MAATTQARLLVRSFLAPLHGCIACPSYTYTWPGSNWQPSACGADVIATRPQVQAWAAFRATPVLDMPPPPPEYGWCFRHRGARACCSGMAQPAEGAGIRCAGAWRAPPHRPPRPFAVAPHGVPGELMWCVDTPHRVVAVVCSPPLSIHLARIELATFSAWG